MKRTTIIYIGLIFISSSLLQGCMYDLRTRTIKKEGITDANVIKGKEMLDNAWKKQGYDKLNNHKTYSFHGSDTWKGVLGKMGQIWPELKSELDFKYRIGSFDGQVTFMDGEERGNVVGLQNWNYYEIAGADTVFKDKDHKKNQRKVFGLAAFQYFNEMIDRLKDAPIISYAGEDEMRGQKYHLVFCTWQSAEPHMEHDQYLAWINQETGLMDFTQYTIRESYLKPPGYKMLGGGIEFTDFKDIDGVMIPHEQLVYAIKLREKPKRNLHRMIISDFEFDGFDEEDLRVNKHLASGGDYKK